MTTDTEMLRKLAEKAVQGPWKISDRNKGWFAVSPPQHGYWNLMCKDDAAYIAAANPTAILALLDRVAEAEALAERLKLEAQVHAQEARTANSTIYEIYQAVSGATGEPGNWNGAQPVIKRINELTDALALILPLAKGYAAAHQVGSNAEYVSQAEAILLRRSATRSTATNE